ATRCSRWETATTPRSRIAACCGSIRPTPRHSRRSPCCATAASWRSREWPEMPIVGPLREFGVQDVFQLLSLSRKTVMLSLTAPSRTEGFVVFDAGRVANAGFGDAASSMDEVLLSTGRIGPLDIEYARRVVAENGSVTLSDVLVQAGAIAPRDLERALRQRIESVVFDLMTWRDGQFAFEEAALAALPLS